MKKVTTREQLSSKLSCNTFPETLFNGSSNSVNVSVPERERRLKFCAPLQIFGIWTSRRST